MARYVARGTARSACVWLCVIVVANHLAAESGRAAEVSKVIRGDIATTDYTRTRIEGHVTVFKTPDPNRRLDFVTIVPAKVDEVWSALTTVKGIQGFYVPGADVDLRPGGTYEMHYAPDAPPGQRGMEATKVLSFVPDEVLSGTGSAPPEFPTVQKEKTKWVILLDGVEGGTRVQMSMIEWGVGDEWDRAFDYFEKNNPPFLEALYARFADGPVDWKARGMTAATKVTTYDHPKTWRVDKSLTVKADPLRVWNLFTTSDGLRSWFVPDANVELKFGGLYERLDNPTAQEGRRGQEGTRIMAYLPRQMLSYTWLAPPQFPEVRKGPAWETWRFSDLGDGWVRIRYTALGMGNGEQWQDAFNLLDQRMEFVMENLRLYLSR